MRLAPVLAATLALAAAPAFAAPKSAANDPPTDVSEAVVQGPAGGTAEDPVICRREAPTGSRIAVKICKPKSAWVKRAKGGSKVGDPAYSDGLDDGYAPLPSSGG